MQMCKQSITLGPSASNLTNTPSLRPPEFRKRSNVHHFWSLDGPSRPKAADSTALWGPRGGRRRPGTMEICKQSITLGPAASKLTNSPSL